MPEPRRRGPRTLRARLTLWILLSTALSLTIFALVAYAVVVIEERREDEEGLAEEPSAEVRDEVLIAMAFAAPIGLALAAGGASWLTRRALGPVDQVIHAAAGISAERLDQRMPVPASDGELRDLVLALNGLLTRIEGGYTSLARYAADASHELRTPLAVIGNELEVALRRPRSVGDWEASARSSLDEVRRLGRLVEALLRLARTDSTAPRERVELATLIEQIMASQAAAAMRAGVSLLVELPEANTTVDADPDALASALANLIGNAIRYSPRLGVITVTVASRSDRLAVLVEDSGPGLTSAELETIFTPFTRGVQGRRADAADGVPGLGLGLAIARRVAQQHGGQLHAEQRPAGGARFVLELPRAAC